MKTARNMAPLRTALIYALFSAVWILVSDEALNLFVSPTSLNYLLMQTLKGWLFVLASASLLYLILRRDMKSLQEGQKQIHYQAGLLKDVSDAVISTNMQFHILSWNAAAESMYGWKASEVIGHVMREFIQNEYVNTSREEIIKTVLEQGRWKGEVSQNHKNGVRFFVSTSLSLVKDQDGQLVGFVAINRDITERKQIEEALLASEMRFRSLIENGLDNISLLAADGTLLWESPATVRALGYEHEQFKGHNIFELIHPDDRAWMQLQFTESLGKPGHAQRDSFRIKHSDGSWRWLESIGTNLLHEPSVNAIVINYRDVTERKETEEALRASEENYRDLVENSQSLICTHDLDGNLLSVNEAAVKLTGYSRAALFQMNLKDVLAPYGEEQFAVYLNKIKADGEAHGLMKVRIANGEFRIWAYNNTLRDEGLEVPIIRGSARDVTERKLAEDALSESEERFHKAFRSGPVGMAITTPDGRYIEANNAFSELTGFTHEELISQTSLQLDITTPEQRLDYTRQISEQGFIYNQEMVLRRKSGESRIALGSMEIIELNHEACVLTTAIDITERKQAEAKVIHVNRLYATISQINQTIVRARNRDTLFSEICHVTIEYGRFRMAWIGLTDEITGNVIPIVFAGEEQGYLASVNITTHNVKRGNGPAGTAIREGRSIISQDTASDPHMAPWREEALEHGYLSSAAVPIKQKNRPTGVFIVYASEPQGFDDDDQILLDEIGLNISYALDTMDTETERKQAEDALQESERSAHATVDALSAHIAILDEAGTILEVNHAWRVFSETNSPIGSNIQAYKGVNYLSVCEASSGPNSAEAAAMVAGIRAVMSKKQKEFSLEYPCHSPTEKRWFNAHVTRFPSKGPMRIVVAHEIITERKQAEQAIRESEERLRLSLQAANQGLYDFNLQSGAAIVNREYAEMLGYDADTFVETNSARIERLHPDDQDVVAKAYTDYINGLIPEYRVEFRQKTQDGSWKWILSLGKVVEYDAQGKPLRMLGTHTDITERKQAEEKLIYSEARFRRLFEAAKDGILILDAETGLIMDVNPFLIELLGSTRDEICGKELWELGFFKDIKESKANFLELQQKEYIRYEDLPLETAHGRRHNVEFISNVYQVNHRKVIQCNIRDITERKQAEQALHESENKYRALVQNMQVGVVVHNPDTSILLSNPMASQLLGLTRNQMQGKTAVDPAWHFIREDETQTPLEEYPVNLAIASTTPITNLILGILRSDLEGPTWVQCNAYQVWEQKGQLKQVVVTFIDITKRKQSDELIRQYTDELEMRVKERTIELIRANHAKDEFLANMSHELRTPLNGILGFSEALSGGIYGSINKKQNQAVEIIQSSGQHLLGLINDILDVSKIEAGKFELQLENVAVNDICQSSLVFVKQLAGKKSITVEYSPSLPTSMIFADPRRLKQILVNLLNNAVKFTPEKGRVKLEVKADAEADQMWFSITDTGIGITPEDLQKLFKPFVQVDSSLARQYEGSGLGLSLVKKLVEMHGGSIGVESEAGKGSSFYFTIPTQSLNMQNAESEKMSAQLTPNETTTKHQQEKKRILLVEDNATNMMVTSDFLNEKGYQVIEARDGLEAIEHAHQQKPDLILMDIQMPNLNGFETIKRLRAAPELASVPIIALTALAMPGDRERCLEAGATEYMAKPASLKQLAEMMENLLQK